MAGYILKAAIKSPFKSKRKDLCAPHPKHSTPKRVLLKQGIIYFSKSNGCSFIIFETEQNLFNNKRMLF